MWLINKYPNIKFAMNTHSYGGYFMWPPGAYKTAGREVLPRIDKATEEFFWESSRHILSAVQSYRGTAIIPGRTGPVVDVLYSAAGNSADEFWYNNGIIGWDFEVGADRVNPATGGTTGVGFQPAWAEAHDEAMEFSNGWIGILEVAAAATANTDAPRSKIVVKDRTADTTTFTFETSGPANVYYTLDGSRPTFDSPKLNLAGMREGPQTITIDASNGPAVEVKWFSVDIAGLVENGYAPTGTGTNYRHQIVSVGLGHDIEQTITADMKAGLLAMSSAGSTVTMPATTLTGYDQIINGALNSVTVQDGRGTSGGWSMTGQVSDFVGPNGVIVADNLGWTPAAHVLPGNVLPTLPGNNAAVSAGSSVAGGSLSNGLASSRTLCTSPAGNSAGAFQCNAGLKLGIPGSTRLGTYVGVLTLTLV